jgi:tetratricopeptide (TPR) repeat protein
MASDMSRSIAILIKVLISILLFEAFTAILAVPILLHFQRMSKVSDYMFDALKLSQEGEYEKAISYLDKAIDYDPNHFRAYERRAELNEQLGDNLTASGADDAKARAYYEKAIQDYQTGSKLGGLSTNVRLITLSSITRIYIKLEQYHEAKKYAEQMLEIQPGYQRAQDLLKIIEENSKTTLNYIFTAKRYGIPERSQAF